MSPKKRKEKSAGNCFSSKLTSDHDADVKLAKVIEISKANRKFLTTLEQINLRIDAIIKCMDMPKSLDSSAEKKQLRDAERVISQAAKKFLLKFNDTYMPVFDSSPSGGGK